jgi:hypothetical protein
VWINSAIARLKPAYRDTAVLVAGQQLTYRSGRVLGIAEATVAADGEVRRMLSAGPGAAGIFIGTQDFPNRRVPVTSGQFRALFQGGSYCLFCRSVGRFSPFSA